VAESKPKILSKKTTVTVSQQLLVELKNEQNRLLNSGQSEPSQGDLVLKAWRFYRESYDAPQVTGKGGTLTAQEAKYVDALLYFLREGNE
jgi:hypothetical protein